MTIELIKASASAKALARKRAHSERLKLRGLKQ